MQPIISSRRRAGRLTTSSRLCNSIHSRFELSAGRRFQPFLRAPFQLIRRQTRMQKWVKMRNRSWSQLEVNLVFLFQAKTPEYDPASFLASKGAHDEHAKQADWHVCDLSHELQQISTLNLHAYRQILHKFDSKHWESQQIISSEIFWRTWKRWQKKQAGTRRHFSMHVDRSACSPGHAADSALDSQRGTRHVRHVRHVRTCFQFFANIRMWSIMSTYSNKVDLPANWPSRQKDLKYLSNISNCLLTLVVVSFFTSLHTEGTFVWPSSVLAFKISRFCFVANFDVWQLSYLSIPNSEVQHVWSRAARTLNILGYWCFKLSVV